MGLVGLVLAGVAHVPCISGSGVCICVYLYKIVWFGQRWQCCGDSERHDEQAVEGAPSTEQEPGERGGLGETFPFDLRESSIL